MTDVVNPAFANRLARSADLVSDHLAAILSESPRYGEVKTPQKLSEAMAYAVLNGGKRIRPFLVLETAGLFKADTSLVLDVACALECIHCYSLVHDDLPAMDDDDLRRGKPTVHVAYDEATAILAGDALLTLAFDLVCRGEGLEAAKKVDLACALARAAGRGGMVGGQVLDLAFENQAVDASTISKVHKMKTGALLRYACEAGAICGGASTAERQAITQFGDIVGEVFQLADDILDVTASSDALGKTAGKDVAANKKTHVALHGIDWARSELQRLLGEAERSLSVFGREADVLRQAAHFAANRSN
ncbi:MAG: polyprenyl synthetase family protein [Pseudomonadota bacterium]